MSQKDFGTQILIDNENINSGYWERINDPIFVEKKGKKIIQCQLRHPTFPLFKFELQAEARKKQSSDGTIHGTVFSPAFKSETLQWRVIH